MTALRCLVVDNQPATLDQLARMLRAQPSVARVSTAAESAGALRMLHHMAVDVAFIEARMPGIDGVELAWLTARAARLGLGAMTDEQGLALFDAALAADPPVVVAARLDLARYRAHTLPVPQPAGGSGDTVDLVLAHSAAGPRHSPP